MLPAFIRRLLMACMALTVAACTSSLGTPTVQPLPEPDSAAPLLPAVRGPLSPRIANYVIDARFDAAKHHITATQILTWTNTSQRPVDMLPFHLYMNAFKNEMSVFMRESRGRHRSAAASARSWGWIDVSSLRIAGVERIEAARVPDHKGDETVLEVPLEAPIGPGETVRVEFAFEVQLPEVFARTGFKDEFHLVAQWFPKIGVLTGEPGRETWHCKPFHLNSEFFADFGTYEVSLTVPSTYVIAATGVLTKATDNGDGTYTLVYRAEDVHDFAWMADPYMKIMSAQATTDNGPVEVRVYYRPPQAEFARRHLRAGVGAIEHFSRLFVPYPWSRMSIIDPPPRAASGAGGMEYPTFVTTAGDSLFTPEGIRAPEFVTVHEVGHNWFQGILASNEVEEAWLDEGVNEYADSLVMEAIYGPGTSSVDWAGFQADHLDIMRATSPDLATIPVPVATPSYAFPDRYSYGQASYPKSAMVLSTLEHIAGREPFLRAFQEYARRFQFRHPTGADFVATIEEVLGQDIEWYWRPAMHTTGMVAHQVRDITCEKSHEPRGVFGRGKDKKTVTPEDAPDKDTWSCEILLTNIGRVPAPVNIRIEFADGTVTHERWQPAPEQSWQRVHVSHTAPATRVTIDPDWNILIDEDIAARDLRTNAQTGATRRAAARISFWTQTAMQVLGL